MTRFKKIMAILLSATLLVAIFAVSASAATVYDKAVKLSPMEMVSGNFKNTTAYFYKIVLSDSGKITFYCSNKDFKPYITLLDSNGNAVISRRWLPLIDGDEKSIEKKGTYYVKLDYQDSREYFENFYYGFEPDNTPTMTIGVNMKVGDTLDLSAFASNYSGKVRWGTTKSKVATVSKGKVTAVAAGTAKIRAYMDNNEYTEIYVKVTKK